MNLLAISGSLRACSSNTALLRAAKRLAPPGVTITLYEGLAALPIFNPDDDIDPAPPAVLDFRARLRRCDGLLIACPEYAHGVPGGIKNALDWVVGSSEVVDKPTALLHASARSAISREALAEILVTMTARLVREATATVPLLGRTPAEVAEILALPEMQAEIAAALAAFTALIKAGPPAPAA